MKGWTILVEVVLSPIRPARNVDPSRYNAWNVSFSAENADPVRMRVLYHTCIGSQGDLPILAGKPLCSVDMLETI